MEPIQPEPAQPLLPTSEPQPPPSSSGASGVRWVLVRAIALGFLILFVVAGAVWLVGGPVLTKMQAPGSISMTPRPTVPATPGTPALPTGPGAPAIGSVEQLPRGSEVYVTVEPKDYGTSQVTLRFDGGPGKGMVKEIEVRLTRPDGVVVTGSMQTQTESPQVTLQGTKGTDRIEVIVHLLSGKAYKIIDEPVRNRVRI
jgi:hypothetical protein